MQISNPKKTVHTQVTLLLFICTIKYCTFDLRECWKRLQRFATSSPPSPPPPNSLYILKTTKENSDILPMKSNISQEIPQWPAWMTRQSAWIDKSKGDLIRNKFEKYLTNLFVCFSIYLQMFKMYLSHRIRIN